jgi:hypothetical protein
MMMELYSGVYMPSNRMEKLYSGEIDRNMILRMAASFANAFLPVYKYFAEDVIANARYIKCDDGVTRVNSVQRLRKEVKHAKASLLNGLDLDKSIDEDSFKKLIDDDKKWIAIPGFTEGSILDKLHKVSGLFSSKGIKEEPSNEVESDNKTKRNRKRKLDNWCATDEILKLQKDDEKKSKKDQENKSQYYLNVLRGLPKLQTTVVICEDNTYNPGKETRYDINSDKPMSYLNTGVVVFYKTDFKSCGELLGSLLDHRKDKNQAVTIQSDLSFENNVKNDKIPIIYAGCMAHARRPFYRFKTDELDLCELLLGNFSSIASTEQMMQEHALTPAQIKQHRTELHGILWRAALEACRLYQPLWSDSTELGKAIDYTINNQQKLMHYLSDPFVDLTNNVSEHWLRQEALHDASSFGCASLTGRANFDLARTAYASAAASQVLPQEYMVFIMIADKNDVESHPERYSPMAYRRWTEQELVKGKSCECCGNSFDGSDGRSIYGISSCLQDCALKAARRTRAVVALDIPEDMKIKKKPEEAQGQLTGVPNSLCKKLLGKLGFP